MAINISGTTVINNSRQLQNIASVDATTAAVIAENAGGGGGPRFQELVVSSQTWSPKMDGDAYLILTGAGGSGGLGRDQLTSSASYFNVAGGGAGGMCIHKASLSTSQSYSLTIGAGHTNSKSFGSNASSGQNGGTGGTSSFSGNGISLTANGGNGGQAASQGRVDTNVAGGTGGTASGANVYNVTGGRGANCVRSQMNSNDRSGGGGACGGTQSVWYDAFGNGEAVPRWLYQNAYETINFPTDVDAIARFNPKLGSLNQSSWAGANYYTTFGSATQVYGNHGGGGGSLMSRANNGAVSLSTTSASGCLYVFYFG